MAGHSKWANIQHRKGKQDAKRAKIFTRLIREITVAAKMGGGDINTNPRLRTAMDAGRAANMSNDAIERAIKRGAGGLEGNDLEEIRYEGYGPGGVAVLVDCMTNNRNRTVAEVRHAFSKRGGNLGTEGSVAYLFSKTGQLLYSQDTPEDQLLEAALDAGVEDLKTNEDKTFEVLVSPEDFSAVKEALQQKGFIPLFAEVTWLASTSVEVAEDDAENVIKLLEMLEDLDDVQQVYSNASISDELLEKFNG